MTRFQLPAQAPFDFEQALQYMSRSDDEILEIVNGTSHRRVLPGPVLLETRPAANGDSPGIEVRLLAGRAAEEDVASTVRHIYRLDDDRSALPDNEPFASALVEGFPGLPLVQQASPYEALVWAVLGQQINVAFAYRLKRRFIEQYGEPVAYEGQTYFAFPTPERVAGLDHERDLLPLQFSRQKSRYIIESSRAICGGQLDFDAIGRLDDADAMAALQELKGIGQWTAEYILMRGYARRDAIPAGDVGLRYAVGRHLGLDSNASEEQVRELAENWRPYRGEIAFRIWFSFQHGWFDRKKSSVGG